MRYPSPGRFKSAQELRGHLQTLGVDFDLVDDLRRSDALTRPLEVHGKALDNRFCAHPMEGWDGTPEGGPSEHTLRRWRHFGTSGCALVWGGEAFAVQPDGRANPNQLCQGPDSERHLGQLLAALREGRQAQGLDPDGAMVGLQLTHSGRFARPAGPLAPRTAQRHPLLAQKYGLDPAHAPMTDGELEAIGEQFVAAAVLAQRAGYAFVDVKCCHGYLLHEVLASKTREGTYGGALAHRMRLFERIVTGIQQACPGLHVGVRLSSGDTAPFVQDGDSRVGVPMQQGGVDPEQHHFALAAPGAASIYDFDLQEPIAFLQRCHQLGVRLVNVTLGSPYWNPHLQRPAAYPPSDGYQPPVDPLQMVDAHLRTTHRLKQALPDMAFVGTGYTYLQEYFPNVAAWIVGDGRADFAGLGRLLLSYPELAADVCAGRELQTKRICRTFSDCTTGPRNGMLSGCFPLDPYYKAMPEAKQVKELTKGLRR